MNRSDDLSAVLTGLGVDVYRVHGDEINARCPVHHLAKGRESSRYSWYINSDSGLWHCFTCGSRGNLPMLVSSLSTDPSMLWNVQSYLITSGLQRVTAGEDQEEETHQPIDWSEYSRFPLFPDNMLAHRKLDRDAANRFGVRWDNELKAAVLPIVSPLGELWGWQLKKTGWVRNYPIGVHKGHTLFGIERAYAPTAILLESPLDVVRFHSVYQGQEFSAVASFGANVSKDQIAVLTSRFDGLVIAMDNDKAGRMETLRLRKELPSFRRGLKYWKYGSDSLKDIGDMTNDQIIEGLERLTAVYV